MSVKKSVFLKDPNSVEDFHVIWCDIDGTNDGTGADDGRLQGDTISTSTWTVPSGITKDSDSTASRTIKGVTYAINTLATIRLSGGTDGTDYRLTNRIVTANGYTYDHSIVIKCRSS